MKQTVNEIKNTIRRYVNISGYMLINLMPEILFYIRWAELIEKIMATGMPVCKARILPPEKRDCSFKGLYNLKLAINKAGGEDINIITNDIDFNDDMRIFILTGPNRGGKTIFTQAWGIAMAFTCLPRVPRSAPATISSRISRPTKTTPSTSDVLARRASVLRRFLSRQPSAA